MIVHIAVFLVGFVAGAVVIGLFMNWRRYSGTILVTKNEGKTFYTLVLEDYPDRIEFQKKIVFKVESPPRV